MTTLGLDVLIFGEQQAVEASIARLLTEAYPGGVPHGDAAGRREPAVVCIGPNRRGVRISNVATDLAGALSDRDVAGTGEIAVVHIDTSAVDPMRVMRWITLAHTLDLTRLVIALDATSSTWSPETLTAGLQKICELAGKLGFTSIAAIPISNGIERLLPESAPVLHRGPPLLQ